MYQIIITIQVIYTNNNNTNFTAYFPAEPGKAGTRKAKPFWILMKQEMMGTGWQWQQLDQITNHLHLTPH